MGHALMSNENGNHRNGANTNGHQRNSQVNGSVNGNQNGNGNHHIPANGVAKNGNGHHPDSADTFAGLDLLWDSLPASGHREAGPTPGRQPGLPAQGPGQPELQLRRGPHRHRPGQPHLRLRRLGP